MNTAIRRAIERVLTDHPAAAESCGLTAAYRDAKQRRGRECEPLLDGVVQVGYLYGSGKEPGAMLIRLTDKLSGTRACEIEVAQQDIGPVVVGQTEVPCRFMPAGPYVGMLLERKSELVVVPRNLMFAPRRMADGNFLPVDGVAELLEPYEVDGWRARHEDVTNSHQRVSPLDLEQMGFPEPPAGSLVVKVAFHRWVEP